VRPLARWFRRLLHEERGDVAVIETLLWLPVVVVLLGTMGVALRQHATASIAQDAAEAAARAARSGATAADGRQRGEQSLAGSLADRAERCAGTVDTSRWDSGVVAVIVTCETDFGGLAYVTPGPHRVTWSWTETVDAARIARTAP